MTFYPDLLFLLQYIRFVGDQTTPSIFRSYCWYCHDRLWPKPFVLWNKFDQKNGIRVGTAVLFLERVWGLLEEAWNV